MDAILLTAPYPFEGSPSFSGRITYNWPQSGDNLAVIGSCRDGQYLSYFQLQEGKRILRRLKMV